MDKSPVALAILWDKRLALLAGRSLYNLLLHVPYGYQNQAELLGLVNTDA